MGLTRGKEPFQSYSPWQRGWIWRPIAPGPDFCLDRTSTAESIVKRPKNFHVLRTQRYVRWILSNQMSLTRVCVQASSRILALFQPLAILALRIPSVAWAARKRSGLFVSSREWWNGVQRKEVLQESCLMTHGCMKISPKTRKAVRKGCRIWWGRHSYSGSEGQADRDPWT